jgi:hypothetical protein
MLTIMVIMFLKLGPTHDSLILVWEMVAHLLLILPGIYNKGM